MTGSLSRETVFVVDRRLRIIEWGDAATHSLGVPEEDAIGRPCYEVVQGHDPFGRAVCGPRCSALQALDDGHLTSNCLLVRVGPGGRRQRLSADLTALPQPLGGAVVTLVDRDAIQSSRGADSTTNGAAPATNGAQGARAQAPGPSIVHDLVALTTLATSMFSDRFHESLDRAIEWLRELTGAETAELFVAEPNDGDLLLSAYAGRFGDIFSQITRFHPGEGFPGIVKNLGEPLTTRNLGDDPRYLRTRVKEKGFRTYACVPIAGPSGTVGVLSVASRRSDIDLERAVRLLTWASGLVGAVLLAGPLRGSGDGGIGVDEALVDLGGDVDTLLNSVLHRMMLIGNATAGLLTMYDWDGRALVRRVKQGNFAGLVCSDESAQDPWTCPALSDRHELVLHGTRDRWPTTCRELTVRGGVVQCLPLVAAGERVGMVQIGWAAPGPQPPTKHLAALLNAAGPAALVVRQGRKSLQDQERVRSLEADRGRQVASTLAEASPATEQPNRAASGVTGPSSNIFLDIRCLGAFELHRGGRLITPDMFRRRASLTVLKILAIHERRPVPREVLTEWLWPETDPDAATNRLYVLIHALRQMVEPERRGSGWVFIRSDGDSYCLSPEAPYRLDVAEFREHVSLGERLEREGDAEGASDVFRAAADLYRGDLLEDTPYAEWCLEPREHLKETCLDVLGKLADRDRETGVFEQSVRRYRQSLRIDPLRERVHQELMRTLWQAGRPDEALRQYNACREMLRRELGVDPLPETQRLYDRIRKTSFS